jgi:transposase
METSDFDGCAVGAALAAAATAEAPCWPATDHRPVVNGILWVLRSGSPWRSLPERFGSWKTVSSRFYRLKQWRRIATRYEKRAANYVAMVTVAAILLWL